MKHLLTLFFLLSVLISCDETFETPPKALLQATFWNSSDGKATSPAITVTGIGKDSLIVDQDTTNSILLPLAKNDSSGFILNMDSIIDTLYFMYQTEMLLESMETGFYYEYKLDTIRFSKNRIDSLKIIDSLITKNWNENIQLYIHPLSDSDN